MVTFPVDDVAAASDALPTQPFGDLFGNALVIGGDRALPVLVPDGDREPQQQTGRPLAGQEPLELPAGDAVPLHADHAMRRRVVATHDESQ